jgi:pimeloyl-ACP methyl ester carboxylesterase
MLIRTDPTTRLDVEQLGDATNPALLMICATSQHYPDWGPLSAELVKHFHLITYNHRGMGASDRGTSPISTTSLAVDAAALLQALDVPKAHVLGWSLGSTVAQELALLKPELIESLVLWGTWSQADGYLRREFLTSEYVWQGGDLHAALTSLYAVFSEELLNSADFNPLEDLITADFLPNKKAHLRTVAEQWEADMSHNSTDRLGRITAPTLVISGEEDVIVPVALSRKVAKLIPGAEFHIFSGPGSSHAIGLERPSDFAEVLLHFLKIAVA